MAKERRLGRGLEALLGRTARGEHRTPEPEQPPVTAPIETMKTIGTSDSMVGPVIEQAIAMNQHRPEPEHEHQPEPTPQEPTPPRLYQAPEETVETVEVVEVLSEENMTESEPNSELDVVLVDVRLIEPNPFQPRRDFGEESLNSLSESIAEHGLLQPLVVRRVDESYQLIAGERRFRAAQKSGLNEVPVRVVEADDRRMTELAIVENLQRKDLNALEKAA
ncbi:MAG: ParB/RepB/Spo0J family partition protein, partial [Planctomycetia bacterium]